MAQLASSSQEGMPLLPSSASQQFRAIAFLRWKLFVHAFRRKGGKGELAAMIFVYPFAAIFLLGPIVGSGFGAYFAIRNHHPEALVVIFWLLFALQVVVSVNIAPPALPFEPSSLIRFPLSFVRYLAVRVVLGLLAVSTLAGTLGLLSAAIGVSVARPVLAPLAFAAALSLALTNMLFVRMIFAWVDRWLSTRRARELFMGVFFVTMLGVQYLNVTFNNVGGHASRVEQAAKVERVSHAWHTAAPVLQWLPPGLAARAITVPGIAADAAFLAGVLAFGGLFLAVFASRMHKEFLGENLSEGSVRNAAKQAPPRVGNAALHAQTVVLQHASSSARWPGLSPLMSALLRKEVIYLRRNVSQFYGVLAPLAMVFIFAGRLGRLASTGMVFPAAVLYAFLGLGALSYNALGLDGAGFQGYLLAPIRMRSVFLAKNLFGFAICLLQLALVYTVVVFIAGAPPLVITFATVAWILFATLLNVTLGNVRSITTPKRTDPNKITRKQASQLSALMSLGLLLGLAAFGWGMLWLGRLLHLPWLPVAVFLALAAGAFALYLAGLDRVDALVYQHREILIEELTKTE